MHAARHARGGEQGGVGGLTQADCHQQRLDEVGEALLLHLLREDLLQVTHQVKMVGRLHGQQLQCLQGACRQGPTSDNIHACMSVITHVSQPARREKIVSMKGLAAPSGAVFSADTTLLQSIGWVLKRMPWQLYSHLGKQFQEGRTNLSDS